MRPVEAATTGAPDPCPCEDVEAVKRRRADPHLDVVRAYQGFGQVSVPEHVGAPVLGHIDGFHSVPCGPFYDYHPVERALPPYPASGLTSPAKRSSCPNVSSSVGPWKLSDR